MSKSIPIIKPGAEQQLLQIFRESIESHDRDITAANQFENRLEELYENGDITGDQYHIGLAALGLYAEDKEASIEVLSKTIKKYEGGSNE